MMLPAQLGSMGRTHSQASLSLESVSPEISPQEQLQNLAECLPFHPYHYLQVTIAASLKSPTPVEYPALF